MTDTTVATGLKVHQWDDNFFQEYVRASRFSRYMDGNENAIIHTLENLTKKPGDRLTVSLIHELAGTGVTGNTVLEGSEEALDNRSHMLTVDTLRHGVLVTDNEQQKTGIDLRNAGKVRLKNWIMKNLRDAIIAAMQSINGVAYATASAAQRDVWLVDNADRALFGAAKVNNTGVHSTSLLNVDAVNDVLTPGLVSLAKRMAKAASPAIRPVITKGDEEWFVLFANSRAFRDLQNDAAMMQANRDALERGKKNPLFTGGDLIWDGVIIREIPEIPVLAGVGAVGIDVAPNFFCGAQAVGVAWAQRTKTATQDTDYKFRHGVAIQEIRGVEKLTFGKGVGDTTDLVDHGMLTLFTAGVADA